MTDRFRPIIGQVLLDKFKRSGIIPENADEIDIRLRVGELAEVVFQASNEWRYFVGKPVLDLPQSWHEAFGMKIKAIQVQATRGEIPIITVDHCGMTCLLEEIPESIESDWLREVEAESLSERSEGP